MIEQIKYKWRWLGEVFVFIFLVLFGFVLLPYGSFVYEKAILLADQKEQINFMSNWQQRLSTLEERRERLNSGMQTMVINLADQEEFSKVVETFFAYAENSLVEIKRIEPISDEEGEEYISRKLRLEVEGGYHGIARFINSLEQGSYLVTTNRVTLESMSASHDIVLGVMDIEVTLLGESP